MIGVFDSGFGGLTILRAFLEKLPNYNYIYLGDNARAPYGSKSQEVIYKYTCEALDFLFNKGCNLIVLACNTASAKALRRVQQEYLPNKYPGRRVLGVVIPVAEEAAQLSCVKRIGVIGTKATIDSKVYLQELKKIDKELEIVGQATPLLVPLVEEGWMGKDITKKILKIYLKKLKTKKIDTLILGCTHYPFLVKDIKRIMGKRMRVVNSPSIVSGKLRDYLEKHREIEKNLEKNKKRYYYTTDDVESFKKFAKKFLGQELEVRKIIL